MAAEDPLANATGYELMLAKLNADKRRLKDVQSMELKAEVKREILPDYYPYLDGVLSAGKGAQDDVLMTCMVWAIDAGFYPMALGIAEYAMRYRLAMPDQYQRTTACLLAEEFSDMAIKAREAGKPIDVNSLLAVGDMTAKEDMPDEVRAKLHKAMGYGLMDSGALTSAVVHLRRALELNDKAGVKKDIERLEREIKKANQTTTAASDTASG